MKHIHYFISLILGLSLVSCAKEIGNELPAPAGDDGMVTIKAAFTGEDITKVGANTGFSWFWSEGDKLVVTGNADSQTFKLVSGASSKVAEFSGKAVEGDSFTIQFPEGSIESSAGRARSRMETTALPI